MPESDTQAKMDAAAAEAAKSIPNLKTAQDVAKWFATYTQTAGYKRLAKALKAYYGV